MALEMWVRVVLTGGDALRPALHPGTVMILAVIPAHNEEACIAEAVASLREQTLAPDRVIVAADNCTDGTVKRAVAAGADVQITVDNKFKKAGALNQVLDRLLVELSDDDGVFVLDADSRLDREFIETARLHLDGNPILGGVGGTFTGSLDGGLVGAFQRNEYARYARDVRRLKGRVLVLTGTAALFRAKALKDVLSARASGRLPGAPSVYDVRVLTEDNELTLALRHLGWSCLSPAGCELTTEVMESWGALYRQRLRWKRGAVENLIDYGFTKVTWRYWGRQALTFAGCLVTLLYLGALAWAFAGGQGYHWHLLWIALTLIFVLEKVVTVRFRGWRQMALAALLIPETFYDIFLQMVHLVAYTQAILRLERRW
jgi:biofilm PGA synthesis N-glycosyltransferase PgaC